MIRLGCKILSTGLNRRLQEGIEYLSSVGFQESGVVELVIPGPDQHGRIFTILWMGSNLGMWDDGRIQMSLMLITLSLFKMMQSIVRITTSCTCPPCGPGSVGTTSKVKLSPDQRSTPSLEVAEISCGNRRTNMLPITTSTLFGVLSLMRWTKVLQSSKLPRGRSTSPFRWGVGWLWTLMATLIPRIGIFV
jgi:hypothetical protein